MLRWQRKPTECWVTSTKASSAETKSLSHSTQHLPGHTCNTLLSFWSWLYKKNVNTLEKAQRRATRMIRRLESLPYEERLRAILVLCATKTPESKGKIRQQFHHCHCLQTGSQPGETCTRGDMAQLQLSPKVLTESLLLSRKTTV